MSIMIDPSKRRPRLAQSIERGKRVSFHEPSVVFSRLVVELCLFCCSHSCPFVLSIWFASLTLKAASLTLKAASLPMFWMSAAACRRCCRRPSSITVSRLTAATACLPAGMLIKLSLSADLLPPYLVLLAASLQFL